MGGVMCENTKRDKFNSCQQIILQSEFKEANWPQNDEFIASWLKKNCNKSGSIITEENIHKKPYKHIHWDLYFFGKWADGLPFKKSLLYLPQKYIYMGKLPNGEIVGESWVKFLKSGCVYEGNLEDGYASGDGTYDDFQHNFRFSGLWKNSKPRQGTLTFYNDQNISSIEIQSTEPFTGIISYKQFKKYEGQLHPERLVPHGYGTLNFSLNKQSYEGSWKCGQMHGMGLFTWKNKASYSGYYFEGKKRGYGRYTYTSGMYYEGYWKDGEQDGTGKIYNQDDEELRCGKWQKGQFKKQLTEEEWQKENMYYENKFKEINFNVKNLHETPMIHGQKLQLNPQQNKLTMTSYSKIEVEEKVRPKVFEQCHF